MPSDITPAELEADLLPERQTLWGFSFLSPVILADNMAQTTQVFTFASAANATAVQTIIVGD